MTVVYTNRESALLSKDTLQDSLSAQIKVAGPPNENESLSFLLHWIKSTSQPAQDIVTSCY